MKKFASHPDLSSSSSFLTSSTSDSSIASENRTKLVPLNRAESKAFIEQYQDKINEIFRLIAELKFLPQFNLKETYKKTYKFRIEINSPSKKVCRNLTKLSKNLKKIKINYTLANLNPVEEVTSKNLLPKVMTKAVSTRVYPLRAQMQLFQLNKRKIVKIKEILIFS